MAAAVGRDGDADAQVSQAQCGNKTCAKDPSVCNAGCVCCVYSNGNSRCRPPGTCGSGQEVSICPNGQPPCGSGAVCCQVGEICVTEIGTCSPANSPELQGSVAAVWAALTDAETLTSLGIPSDIAPRIGHRFQIRPSEFAESDGVIEAEVTEVDAPRRFAFKWLNGPLDEPTTVTFHVESAGDESPARVRLTHTDATGEACRAGAAILGRHWSRRLFDDALPTYLARRGEI